MTGVTEYMEVFVVSIAPPPLNPAPQWGAYQPPSPPAAGPPRGGLSPAGWVVAAIGVILALGSIVFGIYLATKDEPATSDEPSGAAETFAPPASDVAAPEATVVEPTEQQPTATPAPTAEPTVTEDDGKPSHEDDQPIIIDELMTSVDVAAAGIDFSWVVLPAAAPYRDFTYVTDDTGAIGVEIPSDWTTDIDTRTNTIDGVTTPSIWAAPDLSAFLDAWTGPGLTYERLTGAAAQDPAVVLANLGEANGVDACAEVRTYDYDDGWYVGSANLYASCGTTGSALLHIVAAPDTVSLAAVQVQMVTTPDVEAAVRVIQTFSDTAEAPAAPSAPQPPAPQPVPAPAPQPDTVMDLPSGLYCRDLFAQGWSYADAVGYWMIWDYPDRMDDDLDGIPCETVYSAAVVEAYWGPVVPPADDSADEGYTGDDAVAAVEAAMASCGYSVDEWWWDGPYEDGTYDVTVTVDVGYGLFTGAFNLVPYSEIWALDEVASGLLDCGY